MATPDACRDAAPLYETGARSGTKTTVMHARRTARDAYFPSRFDDAFFTSRGDVTFKDTGDARRFADKVNARDERTAENSLRPAEVAAMVLVHEIFHAVIAVYKRQHGGAFGDLLARLEEKLGQDANDTWLAFLRTFPTPAIYRGDDAPEALLAREPQKSRDEYTEEVLLLWLVNQNPAYEPVRAIVTDKDLGDGYRRFVGESRTWFDAAPKLGPKNQSLLDLLLEPSRASNNILEQLDFIEKQWGQSLGLDQLPIWRRVLWARDFLHEEGKYFFRGGPGPGSPLLDPMRFDQQRGQDEEPKRFSADLDWMPRVVLMAKTVFVWLDQLSKKYRRNIDRLDQVPDEELDILAARGFTGLWLIGLFERSTASKKVKQMRGDQDAVASAYSLMRYDIAWELGGHEAYENLKQRAWKRGIRLAADMVPNHVGIDSDWVVKHPDWFVQASQPPFPSYRFGGADLSDNPGVGVFIEEGYWSKTDAAVVFRRHDRSTGQDRFIYHGNDGTSMPWNDTAQLDYLKAEVRHAVIETILHVARMFPIIRFDAAMTLAKRHVQRLWYPLPGQGGAIPSRSDYAMTQEEFDSAIPIEFWREVVDTVKERAPDTLLLAEAFWMMEGYFVRTLGMHRVYNSAFMNMLKREENQKYRETIKNVLEFDPEILKRFVNFMSNPDEETAVAQFGSDDKYFGVCVLMCTMPGLPMFGHGQVEGFHEKYGMEYRRAKWEEHPNEGLVRRHEREIFPVAKKRYLFSGVDQFRLYDFVSEGGGIDEDVFAYSNGAGDERALVLYNNKFKDTRGRIFGSVGAGSLTVGDALGTSQAPHEWILFRDLAKNLEYVRHRDELRDSFVWELGAFKYHVLTEFRSVEATAERPYAELAADLAGRGVPSIERALVELRMKPIHVPLREALSKGHVDHLLEKGDVAALEERLVHFAKGVAYLRSAKKEKGAKNGAASEAAIATAKKRLSSLVIAVDPKNAAKAPSTTPATVARYTSTTKHGPELVAWLQLEAALEMLKADPTESPEKNEKNETAESLVKTYELAIPVVHAASTFEGDPEHRAALLLLAVTAKNAPLREALAGAIADERGRVFLGVHEAGGVKWLRKESFEELARLLASRAALLGEVSVAMAERQVDDVTKLAAKEGYKADAIAKALVDTKLAPPQKADDKASNTSRAEKPGSASSVAKPDDR